MLTLSVSLSRYIIFALAVSSLLFLVSPGPGPAEAGTTFVEFSPSNVEILEGESVEVTVTVFKELTSAEVEAGSVEVRLIEQDFPTDDVIDTQNVDVPEDEGEGDTVELTIKFTLKCVDGTVQGASGGDITPKVDFGSGTTNSDPFSVKCKDGIAVIFDPETLEIFEGDEEQVTVHITKFITPAEKNLGTINVDLIDVDGTLDPDDRLGEADVKHTGKKNLAKVVVQHTFTLKCVKNEIQGAKGEKSGEEEVVLAIEIDNGPTNHGTGFATCIQREVSFFNSTGSMPSGVTVDEEAGLAYFLNAGGPGVDVYTTAGTFVHTINLPCLAGESGPADAEPAIPFCLVQGISLFEALGGNKYLAATQFATAAIFLLAIGLFAGDAAEDPGPALSRPASGDFISVPVGEGPRGMAFDPASSQLYVANFFDGTVSVIDVETMTEVTRVTVGGGPDAIAIDSDAGVAYVTNFTGDLVSVIDIGTNQVLDTISVGAGPEGIEVDPETGDVWVASSIGGSVSVIEGGSSASAGPVVDTFPVGGGANDVAINPLTDTVWVANFTDDTVSIIDRATHEVVGSVDVGDGPDALGVSPEAGFIYVANHDDDTYSFISDPPPEPAVSGLALLWGDDDCDGDADSVDALKNLQHLAALSFTQNDPCFPLGQTVGVTIAGVSQIAFGDADCDGDVDSVDALGILRNLVALPVNQEEGCPLIGDEVLIT